MARNVTARAVNFRRGLNTFTLSNKPFIHSSPQPIPVYLAVKPTTKKFTNPAKFICACLGLTTSDLYRPLTSHRPTDTDTYLANCTRGSCLLFSAIMLRVSAQ